MIKISKVEGAFFYASLVIIEVFIIGFPELSSRSLLGFIARLLVIVSTLWVAGFLQRLAYVGKIVSFSDLEPGDNYQLLDQLFRPGEDYPRILLVSRPYKTLPNKLEIKYTSDLPVDLPKLKIGKTFAVREVPKNVIPAHNEIVVF